MIPERMLPPKVTCCQWHTGREGFEEKKTFVPEPKTFLGVNACFTCNTINSTVQMSNKSPIRLCCLKEVKF